MAFLKFKAEHRGGNSKKQALKVKIITVKVENRELSQKYFILVISLMLSMNLTCRYKEENLT